MTKKFFLYIALSLISIHLSAQGVLTPPTDDEDIVHGISFEVGYVNKQFVTDFGRSGTYHEDLFGSEDKFLNGFQFGIGYQPVLWKTLPHFGVGARSGLYFETYHSRRKARRLGYEKFTEWDMHIPLTPTLYFPINKNLQLMVYGGIGMNVVITGVLKGDPVVEEGPSLGGLISDLIFGRDYDDEPREHTYYLRHDRIEYGKDGWPKRFNGQWELGGALRIAEGLYIRASYMRGLTNHNFYKPDVHGRYNTRERKLEVTIGFCG